MPPTILRIPEGLKVTAPLLTTIHSVLNDDNPNIERFSEEPNLCRSYQLRIASLFEAFNFLCEATPPEEKLLAEIQPYLIWCHEYCTFTRSWTAEQYQTKLSEYTTLLVNAITNLWKLTAKQGIDRLDKAEQYYLLQKTRPTTATLTLLHETHEQDWVLIVDKPLAPFTHETLTELKRIKASDPKNPSLLTIFKETPPNEPIDLNKLLPDELDLFEEDNFEDPLTPANPNNWFFYLPQIEKELLYHTLQKINLEDPETVPLLSSRLRTIPGLANFAQHQMHCIQVSCDEIKIHSFEPRLRSSHLGSRDVIEYPDAIQRLHTIRNADRLHESIASEDPESPRPMLIQTLISPVKFQFFDALIQQMIKIPDPWLEEQRQFAVAYARGKQRPIFSTNHPLNYARVVCSTPTDSGECSEILDAAQAHLERARAQNKQPANYIQALTELISEYTKTLKSGSGTAYLLDWNGRELFLSSLEDILVTYLGGVSYGSCVSGKDRKAIQLIHTNTALLYYKQCGRWPSYTDRGPARERFVQLFSNFYRTNHYQLFSGQNAPGSDGIKTPEGYLTTDIITAIKPEVLALDDRLASNNEIEKITLAKNVSEIYPRCISAACRLNENQRNNLLTRIKIIVSQGSYWHSKTTGNIPLFISYVPQLFKKLTHHTGEASSTVTNAESSHSMPDGITRIFNILSDLILVPFRPFNATESTRKLADIYTVILLRSTNILRQDMTENLYKIIDRLITEDPDYLAIYNELGTFKQRIFEINEATASTTTFSSW